MGARQRPIVAPRRPIFVPDNLKDLSGPRQSEARVDLIARLTLTSADVFDGIVARHPSWCRLARLRCPLLLACIPKA